MSGRSSIPALRWPKSRRNRQTFVAPRFSAFQCCRDPHPSTSSEGYRFLKRRSWADEREENPWPAIQFELVAEEILHLPCPRYKPPPCHRGKPPAPSLLRLWRDRHRKKSPTP